MSEETNDRMRIAFPIITESGFTPEILNLSKDKLAQLTEYELHLSLFLLGQLTAELRERSANLTFKSPSFA